jgi:hypothetical protein
MADAMPAEVPPYTTTSYEEVAARERVAAAQTRRMIVLRMVIEPDTTRAADEPVYATADGFLLPRGSRRASISTIGVKGTF